MSRSRSFLVASLLVAACQPSIPDARFSCDDTADCPPGLTCQSGLCRRDAADGGTPDASMTDAARDDASAPDGCTPQAFFRDADGDGYGNATASTSACEAPEGYADNDDDCDDGCAACYPSATEACDGADNDCNDLIDDGVLTTFYADADADGYGDPATAMEACVAPTGHVDVGGDCDDGCVGCLPGGTEVCEGVRDENCSMGVDEGCACTTGATRACPGGSSVGVCMPGTQRCEAGEWGGCVGAVAPATETCNGRDDDCDGVTDGAVAAVNCATVSRTTDRACSGGACVITACTTDWRDCDRQYANGCEAQLGTVGSCTACGEVCGWDCEATGCNDATIAAAGGSHSCFARARGGVVCTGWEYYGQIGNGDVTDYTVAPTPVSGLSGEVLALSLGSSHTCALLPGGAVRCWGYNFDGQMGIGTTGAHSTPAPAVSGIGSGAVAISAGWSHTCALMQTGLVRCWGQGSSGQLGDGSDVSRSSPVGVTGLSGVTQIAAGGHFTCALRSDGTVWCWGQGSSGQLGNGQSSPGTNAAQRNSPVQVMGLTTATAIVAGGHHACALRSSGAPVCWGQDSAGQLGNGPGTTLQTLPVEVTGLSGATAIAAGIGHTCAIVAGGVRCWGAAAAVGTGATVDQHAPVAVTGLTGAQTISARTSHTCALLTNGGARCWGENTQGQLGDNSRINRPTPVSPVAP